MDGPITKGDSAKRGKQERDPILKFFCKMQFFVLKALNPRDLKHRDIISEQTFSELTLIFFGFHSVLAGSRPQGTAG
jgi:hypothetical protein